MAQPTSYQIGSSRPPRLQDLRLSSSSEGEEDLAPPQRPYGKMNNPRDSALQSLDDAEGIFDLYGPGPGAGSENGARDSWQSGNSGRYGPVQPAPPINISGGKQYNRVEEILKDSGHTEYQGEVPAPKPPNPKERISGDSWSGPMEALSASTGDIRSSVISSASANSNLTPSHSHSHSQRHVGNTLPPRISSVGPKTPDITITADNTPTNPSMDNRSIITTTPTHSASPSPVHASIMRLSPRKNGNGNGNRNGIGSNGIMQNGSLGNSSHASIGSSQYAGEEADAYHVRSTYARLEAEGVHGDGWDPGVERTRGGPNTSNNRSTVYQSSKGKEMGESERQFLSSLDRYGFIHDPTKHRSETRMALIPTGPFMKVPKLPSKSPLEGKPRATPSMIGPTAGSDGRNPAPGAKTPKSEPTEGPAQRKKETERVGKWLKMMKVSKRDQGGNIQNWSWRPESKGKVEGRIYKGIPDRWRMAAWWTLVEERVVAYEGKGKQKVSEELAIEYRQNIDQASTFDVQIDLDTPRTISGHTQFVTRYGAGQRSLFHVLHCFSMVCDTCGYVQGMGPIAATLLSYFDPERVYTLLVRLHDVYGMHSIFAPGFPGLLEAFYILERLTEWLMPEVFNALAKNMISTTAWATKLFITLFVNSFPFSQQLRIWDAFWLDGRDVIIMTSLAILWAFKDLLSSPSADFESILSLLSSYFVIEDEDKFMSWINRTLHQQGMKEKIGLWRSEWQVLVKEGKTDGVLL